MYLVLKKCGGKINAVKVAISSVIFNTGQIAGVTKFFPIKAGGEIGKNFLLMKISMYTCTILYGFLMKGMVSILI